MKSKLFFNYPTCIDHAFIDDKGKIVGGSIHPRIMVSGIVTEEESVVVDFSSGKRRIKEIIDSKDRIGLDHKLWWITGFSEGKIEYPDDDSVTVITEMIEITIPRSDFHIFSSSGNFENYQKSVENEIKLILEQEMSGYQFDVSATQVAFSTTNDIIPFRYVHGLKNSTSYGCKNIAHGHLSFFEVTKVGEEYSNDCDSCKKGMKLVQEAVHDLDGCIFINKENIIHKDNEKLIIKYDTPRGEMSMQFNPSKYPHIILDTETTIEYIAEYFKKYNLSYLDIAHVREFAISEGLQKGVIIEVEELDDSLLNIS